MTAPADPVPSASRGGRGGAAGSGSAGRGARRPGRGARPAGTGAATASSPARRPGSSAYTAAQLQVLEGLEAVRKRPGMYIGSTDSRGLAHLLWEIVDNSVDEALAGHASRVDVVLHADGSVEVRDDGRGIPVDVEPKTGLTGVEVVMTRLHAGGKFGGGSYTASGGLHGVGASVVNALSARCDVEVDRGGVVHVMSFQRGAPGVYAGSGPDAEFTAVGGLRTAGKCPKKVTGTRTRFWPDPQIFTRDAALDLALVHARARQTAFLVPGLALTVRDQRGEVADVATFRYEGGVVDFADHLAPDEPVCATLHLQGHGSFRETVPVLDGKGHLVSTEVERDLGVDVALRWGSGYEPTVRSFVNVIATPKGGTHLTGFERALVKTLNDVLRATRTLKVAEESVTKDDVLEGLTAVVTVRLAEPQFEGQTKEVLGTPAAAKIVADVVGRELKAWLTSSARTVKPQAKAVLEKVADASRTRIAARHHKETQRRKNALESSSLPAKLADCRSDDVDRTELWVVEGDSALGTAKLARNSEYQALLPIRGKILNTQKASIADMLKNAECASIIQVLGAGSGRSFDLDACRYGKLVLMCDADVDGAHIRCLLLTLVHQHLRPLLEAGRVYAAVPPLHRLEVAGSGKRKPEVVYTYSDAELRRVTADLERRGRTVKRPVQRYKGLGEMDADQLAETTMEPGSRLLRRITVGDATAAAEVFDLLMGSDVAPRKAFLVDSADRVDRAAIDA